MISRYLISVLHTFAVTFNQWFNLLNEVWVHLTNSEDWSLDKLWVSCNLQLKWSILALLNRTSCFKISSTLSATFTSECLSCNEVVVWIVQPSVILAWIKESQADVYLCMRELLIYRPTIIFSTNGPNTPFSVCRSPLVQLRDRRVLDQILVEHFAGKNLLLCGWAGY